MATQDTMFEQIDYRLALLGAGSRALWNPNEKSAVRLPRVVISRSTRIAAQLQQVVERNWHSRAIVLEILPGKKGASGCAVLELLPPNPQSGLVAFDLDEIPKAELTSQELEVVEAILSGDTTLRGPFARLGWIEEALEWMQETLGHDIKFTGEVTQLNATGRFALARFATRTGPGYWLKATGEPNVHEFQITKLLATAYPEFLPPRIAERKDWNAWLMEDAGCSLAPCTLSALERAVSVMAMLQQKTIGQANAFLAAGAFDQRLCVLRTHMAELVDYLAEAMARQVSTKVPRIGKLRLKQIGRILEDATFRMEELEVPDTLIHCDVNSGNILFQGTKCVFTDWCEAGIGIPFVTLQYLSLLHSSGNQDWGSRLRKVYKQCWLNHLTSSQIDWAFALMPLLALLSSLYGRGMRLAATRKNNPQADSYARSLARRMDRAAQDLQLLRALCH